MSTSKLQEYLEEHHVAYKVLEHETTYTAQESAARSHVLPQQLAKTVIVKLDGGLAMAVLPANEHLSLTALKEHTGAHTAELATELDFKDAFPDCDVGAMPPFGNLYGLAVYVDETLARNKQISFNACSHDRLARMAYADFERLVHPHVIRLTGHRDHHVPREHMPLW